MVNHIRTALKLYSFKKKTITIMRKDRCSEDDGKQIHKKHSVNVLLIYLQYQI